MKERNISNPPKSPTGEESPDAGKAGKKRPARRAAVLRKDIKQRKQAENALRVGEGWLRTSLEALIHGFAILSAVRDGDGKVVDFRCGYINEAGCRMSGMGREEMLGRTMLETFPAFEGSELLGDYIRTVETGESLIRDDVVYAGPIAGGEPASLAFDVRAVKMGEELVVSWMDVTERRKTTEAMARLASFPELNPNPIVEVDAGGAVCYVNPTARALFPDLETLGPSHPWLLGLGAALDRFRQGECRRESRGASAEGRHYHQDFVPLDGLRRIRIYGVDITERVHAEEAFHRRAEELERLLESVPAIVWIAHDPACRHITGNRTADEFLRLPRGAEASLTAPGERRPTHFRVTRNGSALEGNEMPVQRAARGETVSDFEFCVEFDDGTIRQVTGNSSPLFDPRGMPRGSVSAFIDITERKRAEEALLRSVRRLDLLASTANELLQARNPQEVVESLCRRVMEHLDCHVFFNYLVDAKGGGLRLNAFAGIPEEEARQIVRLDPGTAVCECAARDCRRIVAERIPSTPDGRTELVKWYGIKAYACHPLVRPGGKPIGTLSFGTRSRETFSEEDLSLMQAVTDHVALAMNRMRDEEALRASLEDKDNLLRELSHRTKNNMQVVASLLELQRKKAGDAHLTGALGSAQGRIRAMALVHEKLYRSGSVTSLNMKEYVRDLVTSLLGAYQGSWGPVQPTLEVEEVFLSVDTALPCGLIINELVSNSLKHAFRERRNGNIFLSLRLLGEEVELRYSDDGPGLPRELRDLSRVDSLGLKLVHNLAVRQLRGKMEHAKESEAEFVFRFRDIDILRRL